MPRLEGYIDRHPDWTKPPFPYTKGARLKIFPHTPPNPPPERSDISPEDLVEWRDCSPLERCLNHPPPLGEEIKDNLSFTIEFGDAIHAGDGRHSQVIRVKVDSTSNGQGSPSNNSLLQNRSNVVAKIYDPLYLDHNQHEFDPFKIANSMYPMEALVYMKLSSLQGWVIPKFYGSFTCSFPVRFEASRLVRLILMEFIPGKTLLNLNPQKFDLQQRQKIMGDIVDAETAIYTKDVKIADMAPRNVILTSLPSESTDRSQIDHPEVQKGSCIMLIDFDSSCLGRHLPGVLAEFGEDYYMPGVYISPLLRWPNMGCLELFEEWIDWDWVTWLRERYAKDKISINEQMRKVWKRGYALSFPPD